MPTNGKRRNLCCSGVKSCSRHSLLPSITPYDTSTRQHLDSRLPHLVIQVVVLVRDLRAPHTILVPRRVKRESPEPVPRGHHDDGECRRRECRQPHHVQFGAELRPSRLTIRTNGANLPSSNSAECDERCVELAGRLICRL